MHHVAVNLAEDLEFASSEALFVFVFFHLRGGVSDVGDGGITARRFFSSPWDTIGRAVSRARISTRMRDFLLIISSLNFIFFSAPSLLGTQPYGEGM